MKGAMLVVSLATLANVLGYMDRVCVSVAAPRLQSEFRFSESELGLIFGAFSLSYALFQTPWGWFADRHGVRDLVAAVIFLWSGFTALTALAWSFASMFAIRLLFGVSEAALSPAIASALKQHVSSERRSTAFGIFLAGGRVGGMIAPLLAAAVILRYGWRSIFFVLAGTGLFFLLVWWKGFPRTSSIPNAARPKMRLEAGSLSAPMLALLGVGTLYTMAWQFYATWFPAYLMKGVGFSIQKAGAYTSLPFLFGLVTTSAGGAVADAAAKSMGCRRARTLIVMGGLLASALLLYFGAMARQPELSSLSIALAAGAGDLTLGTLWASAVDLGGNSPGFLAGLMNCCSNLGGFVSPVVIGWMLQRHAGWTAVLSGAAALNVGAACLWLLVRTAPTKPLTEKLAYV
jgi:MFS family permease